MSSESRELALSGQSVAYTLRRSARKTLGLVVDHRGLSVGAPLWAAIRDVEAFVQSHAAWILAKLAVNRAAAVDTPLVLADGTLLPCLGEPWRLSLTHGNNRIVWQDDVRSLELALRTAADPRSLLLRALQQRALAFYAARIAHFCARLGAAPPPLALSSARTRWGSCSRVSGIRLHWRLIHLAPELIDYVVAHEVAHLREMNHSARFWSVVESLYPDYRAARVRLKAAAASLPQI